MDETRGKFVLKAPYQPSGDQPQAGRLLAPRPEEGKGKEKGGEKE